MASTSEVQRVCELGRKVGIPDAVILDAIDAGRAAVRASPPYRVAQVVKYFEPPAIVAAFIRQA